MPPPPGWPRQLVLASASPRRLQLLRSIGLDPTVIPADIDETPIPGEDPLQYACRVASSKATAIPWNGDLVLAADTIVTLAGSILLKPTDDNDALEMLQSLAGRTHQVHTAVALRHDEKLDILTSTSEVTFIHATKDLLAWYVATGEPMDKAGAYAVQGSGQMLIEEIHGSLANVVGLPLAELNSYFVRQ